LYPGFGGHIPIGTTPVTCTATDAAGNAAKSVTFSITVNPLPILVPTAQASSPTTTTTTSPAASTAPSAPAVAVTTNENQTSAPAETPNEDTKEVKGEETNGAASQKACPWWWIIGLILAVILAVVGGFLKTAKENSVWRKYYYIWPFVLSGVAWIAHYSLHRGYAASWFCNYYWLLLLVIAIFTAALYKMLLTEEK
jgi:heme/copper-type cytochrome/quinol oxidase subunit 4